MELTFHLTPRGYFDALDSAVDYIPSEFERDGFIHCTDGAEAMAQVATAYYKNNPEPHYYLYIDKDRVRAPIRYDDPDRRYPHIYGPLNRDAILSVRPARRLPDGTFLAPEPA
ncbi:MAG: DUF952 domain-containing protein [Chloroflexi bacterium]|nr:DUF952 domain-containing protein [Chloroflexota bacterium]